MKNIPAAAVVLILMSLAAQAQLRVVQDDVNDTTGVTGADRARTGTEFLVARQTAPTIHEPSPATHLVLSRDNLHHMTLADLGHGAYELRTTGNDPHVFCEEIGSRYNPREICVLAFEYFCPSGLDSFELFYGPPISAANRAEGPKPHPSEAWVHYSINLLDVVTNWDAPYALLRLDFGRLPDVTIQIRNLCLRAPTAAENQLATERDAKRAAEQRLGRQLAESLATSYDVNLAVRMEPEAVVVSAAVPLDGEYILGEVRPWQYAVSGEKFAWHRDVKVSNGQLTATVERFTPIGEWQYDRIYSRWQLARAHGDLPSRMSQAVWAEDVTAVARWQIEHERPSGKKGMSGIHPDLRILPDLAELGVHSITDTLPLTPYLALGPDKDTMPFHHRGRTYPIRRVVVERHDRLLQFARDHDIVVSAVVLIPRMADNDGNARMREIFMHPDTGEPGKYTMANVTSPLGVEYYTTLLHFLAERYSRPDKKYGRITHWIIHNEVDAGWVWTNCGERGAETYMDLYMKSMRLAYYTVRQYNPTAQVFISLTHHWHDTVSPHFYKPRRLLEMLADHSRVNGDFEWGIAYHPYPQNLRNPRTWEDNKTTFSFDTPIISFRNIEVLDAFVRRPPMNYQRRPRTVLLSEQGCNSPDDSGESLTLQAAGIAYAWKKINRLDTVEAFHYHRWIDHEEEGGLKLGLWTVKKGSITWPETKKPAWNVYKALGTPEEDAACAFAKPIVGISDWSEVFHTGSVR